jgi:hypothetical protein
MTARLHNGIGSYVASVEVPPFETGYPPVLLWGDRCFVRLGGPESGEYFEQFLYVATIVVVDADDHRRTGIPQHGDGGA